MTYPHGTGPSRTAAPTELEPVRQVLDGWEASGRVPGYVAAIRVGGRTTLLAGGRRALGPDAPPMSPDTLFRIASLTKTMGGALVLSLVRDGVITLDAPIDRWLPEAAAPRVLIDPTGLLDGTVAAERPITVRDLLTFTCGWGVVIAPSPLQDEMFARGVFPGAVPPPLPTDEFVARVTGLPLAFQPGHGWLYDTGMDLLGVLVARATGMPLSQLLRERVTGPLGMSSTAFWTADTSRLSTAYRPGPDGLEVLDPPDGAFAAPPAMEHLSAGLVSTAGDVLRFFTAMADGGAPVLTPDEVAQLSSPALTDEQYRAGAPIIGGGLSWGLGTGVDVEATRPWMAPGRWGWTGGTGTTAHVDPVRGVVAVLLTARMMAGAHDGPEDFWTAVAASARVEP